MTKFVCDEMLVESVSQPISTAIETSGAYVGVFVQAKERVARTGTKGIEFSFESNDGASARYLTLWVERPSGEKIDFSYGLLSSLMVCLGLKEIQSAELESEEWDKSLGARVPTKIQSYADLIDREIGVLLERTESQWDGKTFVRMSLSGFFNSSTKQMASEILAGKGETGLLEYRVRGLRKVIIKTSPAVPADVASSGKGKPSFDDLSEDDIPF